MWVLITILFIAGQPQAYSRGFPEGEVTCRAGKVALIAELEKDIKEGAPISAYATECTLLIQPTKRS